MEWVQGYNSNIWNEKADMAAKAAQSQAGTAWEMDTTAQNKIKYMVTITETILDQDTKYILKIQTTRKRYQE